MLSSFTLALVKAALVAAALTLMTANVVSGLTEETLYWSTGMSYAVKEFKVGDKLKFQWGGFHDVYKLGSESKYNSCNFVGAVQLKPASSGGSYEYTFTASDATKDFIYFACSVGSHCNNGQKLKVKVTSEPPSPGPGPAPTPAPTPENPYDTAFSARPSLAIFVGALLLLAMVVV